VSHFKRFNFSSQACGLGSAHLILTLLLYILRGRDSDTPGCMIMIFKHEVLAIGLAWWEVLHSSNFPPGYFFLPGHKKNRCLVHFFVCIEKMLRITEMILGIFPPSFLETVIDANISTSRKFCTDVQPVLAGANIVKWPVVHERAVYYGRIHVHKKRQLPVSKGDQIFW